MGWQGETRCGSICTESLMVPSFFHGDFCFHSPSILLTKCTANTPFDVVMQGPVNTAILQSICSSAARFGTAGSPHYRHSLRGEACYGSLPSWGPAPNGKQSLCKQNCGKLSGAGQKLAHLANALPDGASSGRWLRCSQAHTRACGAGACNGRIRALLLDAGRVLGDCGIGRCSMRLAR